MKKNEELTIIFYDNLQNELKKQRKTQVELCEFCGFSLNSFRTKISLKSAPNIFDGVKIARFLNVPIEYLISGINSDNTAPSLAEIEKLKNKISRIIEICSE